MLWLRVEKKIVFWKPQRKQIVCIIEITRLFNGTYMKSRSKCISALIIVFQATSIEGVKLTSKNCHSPLHHLNSGTAEQLIPESLIYY